MNDIADFWGTHFQSARQLAEAGCRRARGHVHARHRCQRSGVRVVCVPEAASQWRAGFSRRRWQGWQRSRHGRSMAARGAPAQHLDGSAVLPEGGVQVSSPCMVELSSWQHAQGSRLLHHARTEGRAVKQQALDAAEHRAARDRGAGDAGPPTFMRLTTAGSYGMTYCSTVGFMVHRCNQLSIHSGMR